MKSKTNPYYKVGDKVEISKSYNTSFGVLRIGDIGTIVSTQGNPSTTSNLNNWNYLCRFRRIPHNISIPSGYLKYHGTSRKNLIETLKNKLGGINKEIEIVETKLDIINNYENKFDYIAKKVIEHSNGKKVNGKLIEEILINTSSNKEYDDLFNGLWF